MRSLDEKRVLRRFIYSRLTLVLLLIVLVLLLKSVFEAWQREREARESRDAVLRNYEELTAREDGLTERIVRIESERGQEEELRKKFGAALPGEEVIIIVENSAPPPAPTPPHSGIWGWLRGLF